MSDPAIPGIPNGVYVDMLANIVRGGQPTDEGWNWLKKNGITSVVKLNLESEGSDVAGIALGLSQHYYPIPIIEQLVFKPDKSLVQQAVDAIGPNTFIHCEHGQDRTGLVVGAYRVWVRGWIKDVAWQEMLDHGFHSELLGLSLFWEWAIDDTN